MSDNNHPKKRGRPPKATLVAPPANFVGTGTTSMEKTQTKVISESLPSSVTLGDFLQFPSISSLIVDSTTANVGNDLCMEDSNTQNTGNEKNLDNPNPQIESDNQPDRRDGNPNIVKTYTQALNHAVMGMKLQYIKPDGEIVIEESDMATEIEYWKHTLVGTVMGRSTTLVQIESLISKYWTHIIAPEVMYFGKGWYYFRFVSDEDKQKIREDVWNMNGYPMVFKEWSPTVVDELDSVTEVPVWVLFPNLDPSFWSDSSLSKVASYVGRPVCADKHTSHKSKVAFARVLVEVDISKELPTVMEFSTPYRGKILQKIEYEWLPFFCQSCKKVGHLKEKCRRVTKAVFKPKRTMTSAQQNVEVQSVLDPGPAILSTPPLQHLDRDGFSIVSHKKKPSQSRMELQANLDNRFTVLATFNEDATDSIVHKKSVVSQEDDPGGGVDPPTHL